MKRLLPSLILAASPLLIVSPLSLASVERSFTGVAYAPDSGKEIYREQHLQRGECRGETWVPQQQQVRYVDASGQLIAEKSIEFSDGYRVRSFEFTDYRFERQITLDERSLNTDQKLVVDAGFEPYLRLNWDRLQGGKPLVFDFRAAAEPDIVPLRVEADASRPPAASAPDARYYFSLTPEFWLARMFVTPVRISYDENRRLVAYEGVTNLLETEDRYFRAHIVYQYQQDETRC